MQLRKAKSRKGMSVSIGTSVSRVQSKRYDPYRQELRPEQKERVKDVL